MIADKPLRQLVSTVVGLGSGLMLAPLTGALSYVRSSRMFHPSGITCAAQVHALAKQGAEGEVAARLSGPALVRLSGAWWKKREWKDVLGCALRFSDEPLGASLRTSDQDLLFATIRRPWTMALSPLTTRQHDYLDNHYYAVSPFRVRELGVVEWRLTPEAPAPPGASRGERLRSALREGHAAFILSWAAYRKPHRAFDESPFTDLCRIELRTVLDIDQEALRFDPFQTGRGIVPVGLVHALRVATYSSSQALRPKTSGRRHAR